MEFIKNLEWRYATKSEQAMEPLFEQVQNTTHNTGLNINKR